MNNSQFNLWRPVATSAIIFKEEKVLLAKRGHEPFFGYWCLPGGFIEGPERVSDGCVREVEEETGLKIEIGRMIAVDDEISSDRRRPVVFFFEATIVDGEIKKEATEIIDLGWFSMEELPEQLIPTHKKLLNRFYGKKG